MRRPCPRSGSPGQEHQRAHRLVKQVGAVRFLLSAFPISASISRNVQSGLLFYYRRKSAHVLRRKRGEGGSRSSKRLADKVELTCNVATTGLQ